jgi:hypothetical protein
MPILETIATGIALYNIAKDVGLVDYALGFLKSKPSGGGGGGILNIIAISK